MKSNTYFKDSALAALRGNWGSAVLATLIVFVLVLIVCGPNAYTSYKTQAVMDGYSYTSISDILAMSSDPAFAEAQRQSSGTSALTLLLEIFLFIPVEVAFYNAFRKLLSGDTNIVNNTFNFSNYWRKIGGMIWMGILVFLWTLLFFVPGVIKAFSYAMTPYILDEYPELTPVEAIHRSRMMMKNHKFDLFWLLLSFIGWGFLCLFTMGIGYLWLVPYVQTAQAAFYEEVKKDYELNGGLY